MTEPRGARPRTRAAGREEPADGFRALQPIEPEDATARAARKRAQIQRAAIGPFLQHGYAGTGIDDIAAAARISKQTLYKHFAGKEELFLSIIMTPSAKYSTSSSTASTPAWTAPRISRRSC